VAAPPRAGARLLGHLKPLVLGDGAAATVFEVTLVAWTAGEFYTWWRRSAGASAGADTTGILVAATSLGGIVAAIYAAGHVRGAGITEGSTWAAVAGLAVVAAGLALRAWSIATLGRWFTYAVTVEKDQRVVQTGPYRLLRHPGYAGFLLALAGVGLALDNWLSLGILVTVPLVGIVARIAAEEHALVRELGDAYRSYSAHTRRLVPGVW
jgi:protein-S-isoprenylcysteine O-methyltransferase Ste14